MASEDPNVSPMSKLLETLGLTREDLIQRSDQMRRFLTSDTSSTFDTSNTTALSARHPSKPASSVARSVSRSRSTSFRDASPPMTPVKSEPMEGTLPPRQYDSMEMVLERQHRQNRREKKQRKDKGKEVPARVNDRPSNSPHLSAASHSGLNLDSFMSSRDDRRVTVSEADGESRSETRQNTPPVTPQKGKYYRDHSYPPNSANDCQYGDSRQGSVAQSHYVKRPQFSNPLPPLFPVSVAVISQLHTSSLDRPSTPQLRRVYPDHRAEASSPLPRSSSPSSSSPLSSPNKPIVNLVSSPGPMGPAPLEEDYSDLPYTLPPGPYSTNKPDQSYAALIGQAILSSPDHRLTLQEIYDWITIVYPYFKRGETTWMNSIRHVLSTTAVFRKVPRERTVGRSFWAVWDEDLPCFKDGGFKKHLCKDMNGGRLGVEHPRSSRVRKRNPDAEEERKAKKLKREKTAPLLAASSSRYSFPSVVQPAHPLFPPISHATPCHQSYLQTCMTASFRQPIPPDVIFPPLPPTSAYHQLTATPSFAPTSQSSCAQVAATPAQAEASARVDDAQATPQASRAISSPVPPVPELTPNRSSSPISSDPPTSKPEPVCSDDTDAPSVVDDVSEVFVSEHRDLLDNRAFNDSSLRPVDDWGNHATVPSLEPGLILNFDYNNDGAAKNKKQKASSFPVVPSSPTPASSKPLTQKQSLPSSIPPRLSTPPPKTTALPVTPPQNHRISPTHTPLSHKGLHMSPSASLAHYKSNLDPPPIIAFSRTGDTLFGAHGDENSNDAGDLDIFRTPSKKRNPQPSGPFNPVTPKKLTFASSGLMESPLRTPSNGVNLSPFRTPTSRSIFDPHDPGNLLDEELSRMGTHHSPDGLFGKGRSVLLYDSPNIGTSPGACPRWW